LYSQVTTLKQFGTRRFKPLTYGCWRGKAWRGSTLCEENLMLNETDLGGFPILRSQKRAIKRRNKAPKAEVKLKKPLKKI